MIQQSTLLKGNIVLYYFHLFPVSDLYVRFCLRSNYVENIFALPPSPPGRVPAVFSLQMKVKVFVVLVLFDLQSQGWTHVVRAGQRFVLLSFLFHCWSHWYFMQWTCFKKIPTLSSTNGSLIMQLFVKPFTEPRVSEQTANEPFWVINLQTALGNTVSSFVVVLTSKDDRCCVICTLCPYIKHTHQYIYRVRAITQPLQSHR